MGTTNWKKGDRVLLDTDPLGTVFTVHTLFANGTVKIEGLVHGRYHDQLVEASRLIRARSPGEQRDYEHATAERLRWIEQSLAKFGIVPSVPPGPKPVCTCPYSEKDPDVSCTEYCLCLACHPERSTRVTHAQARKEADDWYAIRNKSAFDSWKTILQYIAQQEQQERDTTKLRAEHEALFAFFEYCYQNLSCPTKELRTETERRMRSVAQALGKLENYFPGSVEAKR